MANLNNANNVSVGKPKAGGAVFYAPYGTTIPKNATDELNPAFKCLGYVSDDGLTNESDSDVKEFNAWGGDTVYSSTSKRKETFNLTFIESKVDVFKLVYGEENVTGSIETNDLDIAHKAKDPKNYSFVFEIVLTGSIIKRIVVESAMVNEVSGVTYKDDSLIGYEATLLARSGSDGAAFHEYFAKAV